MRRFNQQRYSRPMDMVMIMTQIMQKFDLSIPPEEMVPENFNSAKAMYRLIQKLEDEE